MNENVQGEGQGFNLYKASHGSLLPGPLLRLWWAAARFRCSAAKNTPAGFQGSEVRRVACVIQEVSPEEERSAVASLGLAGALMASQRGNSQKCSVLTPL